MKNKNNTKSILLAILLVVVVGLISVSFAYFTVERVSGNGKSMSGKAKHDVPKITMRELSAGINLAGTYPMTDEVGLSTSKGYSFEVKNEESTPISVEVIMEVYTENTLDDNLVNIAIDDSVISTLGTMATVKPSSESYAKSYTLASYTLEGNETLKSNIKAWINENGTIENAQNKTWTSKILVIPTFIK